MENKNKALPNQPDPPGNNQNKLQKNARFLDLLKKDIEEHQANFETMKTKSPETQESQEPQKSQDTQDTQKLSISVEHAEILSLLIEQIVEVRFREVTGLTDESQKLF